MFQQNILEELSKLFGGAGPDTWGDISGMSQGDIAGTFREKYGL